MFWHVMIIILTALLMFAGLIGSVLPILPGPPLIFIGALVYAWHTDFKTITWETIALLLLLTLLSLILDFFASVFGAKKYGASRWGEGGALVGSAVGIWIGIWGAILGPFLGAVFLEGIRGRGIRQTLKIGWGTFLGFLIGMLGKIIIACAMIVIFIFKLF